MQIGMRIRMLVRMKLNIFIKKQGGMKHIVYFCKLVCIKF